MIFINIQKLSNMRKIKIKHRSDLHDSERELQEREHHCLLSIDYKS